jgi:uncharacterized protein (TIGR03086 family)
VDGNRRGAVTALAAPGVLDEQRLSLLPVLTTEVLVHTWDLTKAVGRDVALDVDLCEISLERVEGNEAKLQASDMFDAPVAVRQDASVQDRLLAAFGRDPEWTPPVS